MHHTPVRLDRGRFVGGRVWLCCRRVRTAVAIWMILQGVCWAIVGFSVVILFGAIGYLKGLIGLGTVAGLALVAPLLVIALLDCIAGVGVLRRRSWAPPLATIGLILGALLAASMAQLRQFRGGYAVVALQLVTIVFVALLSRKASSRAVAAVAVPAFRRWPPD